MRQYFFLMLALQRRGASFLTTFYGLYNLWPAFRCKLKKTFFDTFCFEFLAFFFFFSFSVWQMLKSLLWPAFEVGSTKTLVEICNTDPLWKNAEGQMCQMYNTKFKETCWRAFLLIFFFYQWRKWKLMLSSFFSLPLTNISFFSLVKRERRFISIIVSVLERDEIP